MGSGRQRTFLSRTKWKGQDCQAGNHRTEITGPSVPPSSAAPRRPAASLQAPGASRPRADCGRPLLLTPGHTFTDPGLRPRFQNTSSCSTLEKLSMPGLARPWRRPLRGFPSAHPQTEAELAERPRAASCPQVCGPCDVHSSEEHHHTCGGGK